jgi:AcrR family transcriptional regulator
MKTANHTTLPFYLSEEDPPAKQAILKAALQLFVRDGLRETSIRTIGDAAGYSNPALFKHFASKEDLALYLFERCYLCYATAIKAAVMEEAALTQNIRAILQRFAQLYDEDADSFLYMQENLRVFWPKCKDRLRHQHSIIATVRRLLARAQATGEARTDIHIDLMVAAFSGFLSQFARQIYFGELKGKAVDWVDEMQNLTMALIRPA